MVLFCKGKCLVMNESGKKLISGVRTFNNCYGLVPDADIVCNSIRLPNKDLWHQHLSIVSKHESILGIPKLNRISNVMCGPCQLQHLDFMGPTRTESLRGRRYIMIMVNDFTRHTWVIFLRSKSDAPKHIKALCTRLKNEKNLKIDRIQSDHGKEFKNSYMESFCTRAGIS